MNIYKSVCFISEQREGTLDGEYRRSATETQMGSVAKTLKQLEKQVEIYC